MLLLSIVLRKTLLTAMPRRGVMSSRQTRRRSLTTTEVTMTEDQIIAAFAARHKIHVSRAEWYAHAIARLGDPVTFATLGAQHHSVMARY